MSLETVTLEIAATWDGAAISGDERATLVLGWEAGPCRLRIEVDAPFHSDPPPPSPPGPLDGLWDYEVVELFVVAAGSDPPLYTEVELSPHGHHLVLRLEGVRNVVERALPLDFRTVTDGRRFQGIARLDAGFLPPQPWLANAFAIHGLGRERRYLAMAPAPGAEVDFHRLDVFPALELAPPPDSRD